LASLFDVMIE